MKKHCYRDDCFEPEMSDLVGRVFTSVVLSDDKKELKLTCDEGVFTFLHDQDCCETVSVEQVTGDLSDLVGEPILLSEMTTSDKNPEDYKPEWGQDSFTWTFYKFATRKGYVDIRWLGESNGWYSEAVDLIFEPNTAAG